MKTDDPANAAAPIEDPLELRSRRWFDRSDMRGFAHRQRMQQMGLRREDVIGKPVIAIINTWSDLSPCHSHLRDRANSIREGILAAGGFPVELPALSLGEVLVKPTTMLYRNLLAMDVEEMLRSNPIDGAVLLGGCDKTLPGLVMAAASVDLPAIVCPAGPMLNGQWRGCKLGAGTHTRKLWDDRRIGKISEEEWIELEQAMTRSAGICNTMGTASTMACLLEAMGLTLPGASTIPAVDSAHSRMARSCGELAVTLVRTQRRLSQVVSHKSFTNAAMVFAALGGSTNAVVHLLAMAGRFEVDFDLSKFDEAARKIPVLVNLFPTGDQLMEDFHFAGGVPGLLFRLKERLSLDQNTVLGTSLGASYLGTVNDETVIRTPETPVSEQESIAVLYGNLAPLGAVVKVSAATAKLLCHSGPAVVFDSHAEMSKRIDEPDSGIEENSVLVLRNAGPVGGPGMPEWGALPIPKRLLARGITDLVRISDARMSGTHYGTCVLHVCPESAVGGPLSLVKSGDIIELNVPERRITLRVSDNELERRKAGAKSAVQLGRRGYTDLYRQHVQQANVGADFDYLVGRSPGLEPDIY
ncbi:dihydroxy-acid dehydratase [Bradyrhizobium guangzhouense]|uniref:dihydroxy-acid dehydratase n=1 Tax=Bradyrhizobium guangzhouense TaxID=1325095 RepID=UPI001009F7BE|nr:dihydroxy-acid dehydratase [Bradyrhizobium guangzhouense]RXH11387.1 dihydroxy-acid dehydratase [Bradyrhizobium guangzhouense]